MKTALVLLTHNAEQDLPHLLPAIMKQSLRPNIILAIDSSSSDNTVNMLDSHSIQIHQIPQSEFDHGGTRRLATELVDADIYIYLTQDAYPATSDAFQKLVDHLCSDEKVGCAYGRQLPKDNATPLSAHLRHFNYPDKSYVRSFQDRMQYGIKTCFNSDSFAAYKRSILTEVGNFPSSLMTAEDMYVAAKIQLQGYNIAYAADACVHHSHNLSLKQEFHRYFSIGVFHRKERWIINNFKSATSEGLRFIKSELSYLIRKKQWHWIPRALASTTVKLLAYHLGLNERLVPHAIKRKMGINKSYWLNAANPDDAVKTQN